MVISGLFVVFLFRLNLCSIIGVRILNSVDKIIDINIDNDIISVIKFIFV